MSQFNSSEQDGGRPVLVIPDLHGRLDLLEAVLRLFPEHHYLSLGDAIDRGPSSMGVVATLLDLYEKGRATLLMGNHELMALDGLAWFYHYLNTKNPDHYRFAMHSYKSWIRAGGESLRSEVSNLTLESFPPLLQDYLKVLEKCVYVTEDGRIHLELPEAANVLVAHASPPTKHKRYKDPLNAALWLRPLEGPFELPESSIYSLHGHTPIRNPMRLGRHVYIDLGAYETGRLALAEIGSPYNVPQLSVLCGYGRPEVANSYVRFGDLLPVRPIDLTGNALMTSRLRPIDQIKQKPNAAAERRHEQNGQASKRGTRGQID